MRLNEARELFYSLVSQYFAGAEVTFTRQSRAAKPRIPLVTITPGNVQRPLNPVNRQISDAATGSYQTRVSLQIDLFTNGKPVIDEETGDVIAYENSAMDDMLSFMDFLNSQYVIEWCHKNDVAISFDGDVQDLTGLVNDNNYEYRSRLPVLFYFTQKTVGYSAVLSEDTLRYPTGETDPETGDPVYSPEEPQQTESTTGKPDTSRPSESDPGEEGEGEGGEEEIPDVIIVPTFEPSSSGGGTEELSKQEIGYFTDVEIKEEKEE